MRKNLMPFKNILFAFFAVFALSQCAENEITPDQSIGTSDDLAVAKETSGSMTISGIYTSYEEIQDCKTCTYVVPASASLVDGEKLGLKAGAVICLDQAKKYGDIEFVNLVGTKESPVRIGSAVFN